MAKIEVFYRGSFSGGCEHVSMFEHDGNIEMKDGGMWIHWTREDNKRMMSFYPNISIIRVNIEEE